MRNCVQPLRPKDGVCFGHSHQVSGNSENLRAWLFESPWSESEPLKPCLEIERISRLTVGLHPQKMPGSLHPPTEGLGIRDPLCSRCN
jgi:hypothetical protein